MLANERGGPGGGGQGPFQHLYDACTRRRDSVDETLHSAGNKIWELKDRYFLVQKLTEIIAIIFMISS